MRTRLILIALFLTAPFALGQTPATIPDTKPGATIVLNLVSMTDESFAKFALDYPGFAKKGMPDTAPQFFSPNDLTRLWTEVTKDRNVVSITTPKLTLGDGRTGSVTAGQNVTFTTDCETKVVDGKSVDVPKTEVVFLGLTATTTPVVSADRSRVSLRIDVNHKVVEPNVPLLPITKMITPVFEGGSKGQPIPFTQFVQRPVFHEAKAETTVSLASGAGVAVYVGKQPMPTGSTHSFRPPVVSKIPYLNRLFRNENSGVEPRHLILIASATVTDIPVAQELVADYHKAVADGRKDDALALAMKALAADPACFAK